MNDLENNPARRIALFQRKEIRRTIHNNEWWFVITDVVAALTDSANPQGYFKDMRGYSRDLVGRWEGELKAFKNGIILGWFGCGRVTIGMNRASPLRAAALRRATVLGLFSGAVFVTVGRHEHGH